jgi:hypothetical protein
MISGLTNLSQSSVLTQMQNKFQDRIQQFDDDGNGTITKSEFDDTISKFGSNDKAEKLFEAADSNGDGELSVDEQNALFDKVKQRVSESIASSIGGMAVGELMQTSGGATVNSHSFADPQSASFEQLMEAFSKGSSDDSNRSTLSSLGSQYAINAYSRNSE